MSASCKSRAMDGRIVRGGVINSWQSAAASEIEIVNRFWLQVWLV